MLELVCLLVNLVPREAEVLDEEGFEDPVSPHDLTRDRLALGGEGDRAVGVVVDKAVGREAFELR